MPGPSVHGFLQAKILEWIVPTLSVLKLKPVCYIKRSGIYVCICRDGLVGGFHDKMLAFLSPPSKKKRKGKTDSTNFVTVVCNLKFRVRIISN